MLQILKEDLYRYEGVKCHSLLMQLRYILFTPGYQYTYFLRHVQNARCVVGRVMWKILLKLCSFKFGIQIPAETKIGKGFRISHWGAIVVNPNAIIGDNFNIAENVLIGNAQGKKTGTPIIGNNVCVNANSVIIGGVTIGNNVVIAPGAFVNFDVPDNCVVIGNPGQIIQRNSSPSAKYIVYSVEDYK